MEQKCGKTTHGSVLVVTQLKPALKVPKYYQTRKNITVSFLFYFNDTDNNWVTTTIQSFSTTPPTTITTYLIQTALMMLSILILGYVIGVFGIVKFTSQGDLEKLFRNIIYFTVMIVIAIAILLVCVTIFEGWGF